MFSRNMRSQLKISINSPVFVEFESTCLIESARNYIWLSSNSVSQLSKKNWVYSLLFSSVVFIEVESVEST